MGGVGFIVWLIVKVEEKYALNAPAIYTGDSMRKILNMMRFGVTEVLDCERALKYGKSYELG